MSATTATVLYVLFLSFCNTQSTNYHCAQEARGQFQAKEDCFEAAAKFVEPGAPPIYDEEGRMLTAALCRRVEEKD